MTMTLPLFRNTPFRSFLSRAERVAGEYPCLPAPMAGKIRRYCLLPLIAALFLSLSGCDMRYSPPFATRYYQGDQLPMAQAIEKGDLESVRRLLPQTDLEILGNESMAFLNFAITHAEIACNQNRLGIITALMRAGADYRHELPPPPYMNSPIGSAIAAVRNRNNPLILKAMLDGGLSPNAISRLEWSKSYLIFALLSDQTLEGLKILVEYGADVNCQDTLGESPLLMAYWKARQFKAIAFLLEQGANPELPKRSGTTLSHVVYTDLGKVSPDYPVYKKIQALARLIQEKGYTWPPLSELEQRDAMRARGETPKLLGNISR